MVVSRPIININTKVESNLWYLDNDAKNHMMGHRLRFIELDEGIICKVKFGDGSTVNIEGKGTIILTYKNRK